MLSAIRRATAAALILMLLTACTATDPHAVNRYESGINPLRIPVEPVPLSGTFAFRQEGDKLTGLYGFRDSFGYQDSVMFSGSLSGGSARVGVTAVRKDGSSNFTADMTGTPASMTGPMMSGTSQHPVRSCSLALTAAR
jgi:hypothetical protein